MKKIGIIHLTGNIGGASVSCYNLVETLKEKYEVVVFCPAEPSDFSDFLLDRGIEVINFNKPLGGIYYYSGGPDWISPAFIKNILYIFKYRSNLLKQLKSEELDLLIVNSKVNAWISTVANELKVPSICFVRETKNGSNFNVWNRLNKIYLNKFNTVSFLSKYDLDRLNLKNNTVVIHDYLKIEDYQQKESSTELCDKLGIPLDTFNILYVGGMAKIKGIDVIIRALKFLDKYNYRLIVAGRKEFIYKRSKNPLMWINNIFKKYYERKIQLEIERFKLEDKIIKTGIRNDMSSIYSIADVVVFPANKPHQARPAFEAGIQSKPIIISEFDNIKEFILNDYNGLYFKKRDPKALAEVIIELITNQRKKEILGKNNYKNAINNHSNKFIDNRVIEMIEEVLQEYKKE